MISRTGDEVFCLAQNCKYPTQFSAQSTFCSTQFTSPFSLHPVRSPVLQRSLTLIINIIVLNIIIESAYGKKKSECFFFNVQLYVSVVMYNEISQVMLHVHFQPIVNFSFSCLNESSSHVMFKCTCNEYISP